MGQDFKYKTFSLLLFSLYFKKKNKDLKLEK
jgi:hypothetical protein